jgi:hypothetical protein
MAAAPQRTNEAGHERQANGRFKPGRSGNPGGKPKGIASEARRIAGTDARKFLKLLAKIAEDTSEKTSDRIRAAEIVIERGFGKAPAFAPLEGENPLELDDISREVAGALDELAARREARVPGGGETRAVADPGTS